MAWFPFFMNVEGRTGLLAGGGRTALDKARRLAGYGPRLIVAAPEILPEFSALPGVTLRRRAFAPEDLEEEPAFVVAATNAPETNREIAALCQARRIPVNVVDMPEACTFLFPALIRRGPLTIGVSTGGASPTAAIRFREEIDRALPESAGEIVEWLGRIRPEILLRVPEPSCRKRVFRLLLEEGLSQNRPLTPQETECIIRQAAGTCGTEKSLS